jgi:hypothetical protein
VTVCRNIKTLFNFDPPATDAEIRAAAEQFVRKVSGSTSPSQANAPAFEQATEEVTTSVHTLLGSLTTTAPAKNLKQELLKTKALAAKRFAGIVTGQPSG